MDLREHMIVISLIIKLKQKEAAINVHHFVISLEIPQQIYSIAESIVPNALTK